MQPVAAARGPVIGRHHRPHLVELFLLRNATEGLELPG